MERAYKIATIGAIISIIALIMIGVSAAGISGRDHNLLGIAWLSLSQISLPIIGPLPLLPPQAVYLMAFADISATSNLFLSFDLAFITSLVFAVGGIMTGIGFYALYKQEQSTMSLISAFCLIVGFGLIAVIIPLGAFPQTTISPWTFLFYYFYTQIIPLTEFTIGWGFGISLAVSALIIVVVYILLGTTMIVVRGKTPKPDLMLSAGILTIIGGLMFIGIIGMVLIFVAYILLALEFKELRK
nr:hypothetical protein [Candidatus Freyarchaeota archaeon]